MYSLVRVISGGQSGVEQCALECARRANLVTGGWAAPHFLTTSGSNAPLLRDTYGLREVTDVDWRGNVAAGYVKRACANIDEADATLFFIDPDSASSASRAALNYAHTGEWDGVSRTAAARCPYLLLTEYDPHALLDFIERHSIRTLNVCGSRAMRGTKRSTWMRRAVRRTLNVAFSQVSQRTHNERDSIIVID